MPGDFAYLKSVLDSSSQLVQWALAIGAGSVVIIISTSYVRPAKLIHRISYLLFLPGWATLAYSIYCGDRLAREYLASTMVPSESLMSIASEINDLYMNQWLHLQISLYIFGSWLILYLLQWVFSKSLTDGGKQ